MQHQAGLLLFRFCRYETHRWPRHRFADCGGVIGVILATFDVGLHIAWRHQLSRVTECLELSAPMMRCRTCLDADQTGRQGRKELQHLRATYALADDRRASTIYPVKSRPTVLTSPMDGSPHSGLRQRTHPMALRCRRVGAVHSIISDRSNESCRPVHVCFAPKAALRLAATGGRRVERAASL